MKQSLSVWASRWHAPSFWLAVGFGSGLLRPAPGTWGSLLALALGYAGYVLSMSLAFFLLTIVITIVLGSFVIDRIERQCGVHDAPEIVIDEFAGQWVALLPLFYADRSEMIFFAAFALFRIFDIWKPYPIGWVDKKVNGGFGVMADDLIAGLYALACIEVFLCAFV